MVLELKKDAHQKSGVPVICPVKNEMPILAQFLDHYRKLGAGYFIFIDNGSTDGSADFLSAQSDCRLYFTDEDYRVSRFATNWINEVIVRDEIAGWLLYADADEHLTFPACETVGLISYCDELSKRGWDVTYAMMLDMYPEGDFLNTPPQQGQSLSSSMPYFDKDYVIRSWPRRPWEGLAAQGKPQVLGGPRCRVLSGLEKEMDRGALDYILLNQVDRFVDAVPLALMPALARMWPVDVPAQQKMPLNFVRPGFKYFDSHTATNTAVADDLLVLLHYKFCAELQTRFRMARTQANHYRRGLHYLQLQQAVQRWKGPLVYAGTEKYTSSEDLVRAGLLGPDAREIWRNPKPSVYRSGASRGIKT